MPKPATVNVGCRWSSLCSLQPTELPSYTHLMRLSVTERSTIRQTVSAVAGPQARVLLFGSRTDDAAKGGDIDLLVDVPQPVASPVLLGARIGARLQMALGDQRIDVLVVAPNVTEQPIHRQARSTGVPL